MRYVLVARSPERRGQRELRGPALRERRAAPVRARPRPTSSWAARARRPGAPVSSARATSAWCATISARRASPIRSACRGLQALESGGHPFAARLRRRAGAPRSLEQHQVVAVDQLGLVDIAEDRFDLARRPAHDAARLGGGVVHQAARDLAAVAGRGRPTTAPRSNSPVTSTTPIGSRLLPSRVQGAAPRRRRGASAPATLR